MDWSRIKTIFIITFLILDVYLLYQLMAKHNDNKFEVMKESSVEERLKGADITYDVMPKAAIKDQYVSAKIKEFTKEDIARLKGQSIIIRDKILLDSELDEPYQLDEKGEPVSLTGFIIENILYGRNYQYWERDDKKNTITYFQQYENKFLYQNVNWNGRIVFHLNDENQIVSYEQTYLEDIKKLDVKEEVLRPLEAVEILLQKGLIEPKSKITKAELGYSTIVPLASSQVFAPTWRFVIDNDKSLYVNAFEGQVIPIGSEEDEVTE
ncbi:two-component system regulatory protein YycI [Bacillus sp. FJAT-27445]|uniref:two-component system regulatory protein YycI n=1 Tax=Bacillus sp. FJAT-27445 TaxID=1679166 RepID=UPI0007434FA0|nr:two-component system regulatory protein YycI [Bacillus sp. FJAT-27445]